jgi:hypothetical protein
MTELSQIERFANAREAIEQVDQFHQFILRSTELAGTLGASHARTGMSPQPLLGFAHVLGEEFGRLPSTIADLERLRASHYRAEHVADAAVKAIDKLPQQSAPSDPTRTEANKRAACVGIYVKAKWTKQEPPSDAEIADVVGCDRTTAFRATRPYKRLGKASAHDEAMSRQETKTGKIPRATKNSSLCNMAKNASTDEY